MSLNKREQARLNNALKIARKVESLLAEGYIVFDEDGHRIKGQVVYEGFGNYPGWGIRIKDEKGSMTWVKFHAEPGTANGMELTIPQYNETFKKWTAVHPRQARRIF
jgi:hypothetical protein